MKEEPRRSYDTFALQGTRPKRVLCIILFSDANINQRLRLKPIKKRGQTDTFEAPTLSLSKGGFEVGEYQLQWSDLVTGCR